jgi:hypothetical protein
MILSYPTVRVLVCNVNECDMTFSSAFDLLGVIREEAAKGGWSALPYWGVDLCPRHTDEETEAD